MRLMTLGQVPRCVFAAALVNASLSLVVPAGAADAVPDTGGWSTGAPRDEIRPEFACEPGDGPGEPASLIIRSGQREGADGYWTKAFPVTGGKHYQFVARYQAMGV